MRNFTRSSRGDKDRQSSVSRLRARHVLGAFVAMVMVATALIAPVTETADAQGAVPEPTGFEAMVDSDGALQLQWDAQDPNPVLYALRWRAEGYNATFERVRTADLPAPQDGKHQFTVAADQLPAPDAQWESAGIKTGRTNQDVSALVEVQVTDGLPEDVSLIGSPGGDLVISWEANSAINDDVFRTVIFSRPSGTTTAWTWHLLNVVETPSGRFEATVDNIGGHEVQMRVIYDNLGRTARSATMQPTAPTLGPLTDFAENTWDIEVPTFTQVIRDEAGNPRTVTKKTDGGRAVLVVGDTVFVGGDNFTQIYNGAQTLTRTALAAFDRTTGEPTNFAPTFIHDGGSRVKVLALELSPDQQTLYVGGQFTRVNGMARRNFVALDVVTGQVRGFDPAPNRPVNALHVDGDRLFMGGGFTTVDGQDRMRAARFDVAGSTGTLSANWTPEFDRSPNRLDPSVKAIVVDRNGHVWLGGLFLRVDGQSHRFMAVVDSDTGALVSGVTNEVEVIAMAANDQRVFIAGGGPGGTAYAYDLDTFARTWQFRSDGNFQAVDVIGDYVYLGGHHTKYTQPGQTGPVSKLARHNEATGEWDRDWSPTVRDVRGIGAIDAQEDGLYVVGQFHRLETNVSGQTQEGWAIYAGSPREPIS